MTENQEHNRKIRCFLFIVAVMALLLNVHANVQQPLQPWRPTPFQPKVVANGGAEALRQSPSLRRRIVEASDRQSIENVRIQMKQRVESVRVLAKQLEQATEDSLTQGGTLRQKMVEAKVDAHQIDLAMKELKNAMPKMREAGRAMNGEFEKMNGGK